MTSSLSKIINVALFFATSTHSFSATKTTMTAPSSCYHVRPYDPSRDQATLEDICKNVYGGTDYLPKMAIKYVNDDSCSFLALATKPGDNPQQQSQGDEEDDDTIVAVANYKRLPAQNAAWIEAVRTHPDYRNQGCSSKLLKSIVELAKEEDSKKSSSNSQSSTDILTCTIKSNKGMQRVFEKLGFIQTNKLSMTFGALRQLPGWHAKHDSIAQANAKPLLDALNLRHLLSKDVMSIPASSWSTITTEEQLLEQLDVMQRDGGTCGFLPGLHEYIVPGPNRVDLKKSLEQGLVLSLSYTLDKEASGCDEGDSATANEGTIEKALLAFTQDERISSLNSKWVCSISAYSTVAFDAALYFAHSSEIAQRMNGKDEAIPFCLTFDDAVPVEEGTVAFALPRDDDECLVFSYKNV